MSRASELAEKLIRGQTNGPDEMEAASILIEQEAKIAELADGICQGFNRTAEWRDRAIAAEAKLAEFERVEKLESDHYASLAFVDVGGHPPVTWKERAEVAEAEIANLRKRDEAHHWAIEDYLKVISKMHKALERIANHNYSVGGAWEMCKIARAVLREVER